MSMSGSSIPGRTMSPVIWNVSLVAATPFVVLLTPL